LRASRVLILASVKSGHDSDASKPKVNSPLSLTVDGNTIDGDGDISFAWSAAVEDAAGK
jgi:hypothetical protein